MLALYNLRLITPCLIPTKILGCLKYFLNIEVSHSAQHIYLSQRKYVLNILEDTGYTTAQPASFPMEQNLNLIDHDGDLLRNHSTYKCLIGRLIYLTITRSDTVHTVHILSQFMHQPHKAHIDAAIRLLSY